MSTPDIMSLLCWRKCTRAVQNHYEDYSLTCDEASHKHLHFIDMVKCKCLHILPTPFAACIEHPEKVVFVAHMHKWCIKVVFPVPLLDIKRGIFCFLLFAAHTIIPKHWKKTTIPTIREWIEEINSIMQMEELTTSLYDRYYKWV